MKGQGWISTSFTATELDGFNWEFVRIIHASEALSIRLMVSIKPYYFLSNDTDTEIFYQKMPCEVKTKLNKVLPIFAAYCSNFFFSLVPCNFIFLSITLTE